MSNTAGIIKLAPINKAAEDAYENLERLILLCRQGLHRGDRGVQARYVLTEEARRLFEDEVHRNVIFEPGDFVSYVAMFPDILDFVVAEGTLRSAMTSAVTNAITSEMADGAFAILLKERHRCSLQSLGEDLRELQRESLDGLDYDKELIVCFEAVCETRDAADLMRLREKIENRHDNLLRLDRRLGMSGARATCAAGARRRLLEAADLINLTLACGNIDTFLSCGAPSPS